MTELSLHQQFLGGDGVGLLLQHLSSVEFIDDAHQLVGGVGHQLGEAAQSVCYLSNSGVSYWMGCILPERLPKKKNRP